MSDISEVARQMATEATRFLSTLNSEQKAKAQLPFTAAGERRIWHYTPMERMGLPFIEMTSEQRQRSLQLFATGTSREAYNAAAGIIGNEIVLVRHEGFGDRHYPERPGDWLFRDQTLYYVTVFGDPGGDEPWGWRFSGHHVSVQFTITDGFIAATPCFLGAHPAIAPLPGGYVQRPLGAEEDFARELLDSLSADQVTLAHVSPAAPPDLIQSNRPVIEDGAAPIPAGILMGYGLRQQDVDLKARLNYTPEREEELRFTLTPKGLAYDKLDGAQQSLVQRLVKLHRDRLPEPLSNQYAELLKDEKPSFAWAGELQRGGVHYYRVQSERILIEYDNSQDSGNHIHSVWRDIKSDFAGDVLAEHYTAVAH